MRQVFGGWGVAPKRKECFSSYDMVSHPLLQMSTSHIVVKRKPLLFAWALLLSNILLSLHNLWRCIFYAKIQGIP